MKYSIDCNRKKECYIEYKKTYIESIYTNMCQDYEYNACYILSVRF